MTRNPDCKPGNRCGNCQKDHLSATRQVKRELLRQSRMTADGLYECTRCHLAKPPVEFMRRDHGELRQFDYCKTCYSIHRRNYWHSYEKLADKRVDHGKTRYKCLEDCGAVISRKVGRCITCYRALLQTNPRQPVRRVPIAVPVAPVVAKPVQMYPCLGECGLMIETKDSRCRLCKKARQDMIAAITAYKSNLTKLTNSFNKGNLAGLMFIGDLDVWSMPYRCSYKRYNKETGGWAKCGRPMLENGYCYECSTGKPRTITCLPRVVTEREVKNEEVA